MYKYRQDPGLRRDDKRCVTNYFGGRKCNITNRKAELFMLLKRGTFHFALTPSEKRVLIPGSMGTASYVLVGTERGAKDSFSSSCHGAGRVMSRSAAKRSIHGRALRDELLQAGIHIQTGSVPGLAEEAPQAYKDVHDVVDVVLAAGIARKVARLRPCVVIKG